MARPFPASAQVWSTPAVIDSKRVSVSTRTGVPLGLPAATPSWAELFSPQQYASPSSVSAQVWLVPAATASKVMSPAARTGSARLVVEPSPSSP